MSSTPVQARAGARMLCASPGCLPPVGWPPGPAAPPADKRPGGRMDKVIVYLDDPAYARQRMPAPAGPTHWLLVACAPRMTHRISKWVSHSARENWRAKWAGKLFDQVVPGLQARGDTVPPILARVPVPERPASLMARHGTPAG